MRVAVMQPYFMPYAGYFRLFAAVDLFVAFDCVQFPRRGWVHRNRLTLRSGQPDWLTLPLQKADRDSTRICDLRFRGDGQHAWQEALQRFPAFPALAARQAALAERTAHLTRYPADYILAGLREVARLLGLERPVIRSSSLGIDPALRGQERILAILSELGAREYVNAPGGRELYDGETFRSAGVRLLFLAPYQGGFGSILERLAFEDCAALRAELQANLALEEASALPLHAAPEGLSAPAPGLPAPGF
jgi:hypothetical protein